jgi:hypothetical protein
VSVMSSAAARTERERRDRAILRVAVAPNVAAAWRRRYSQRRR